jgi:hypothetical protein
MFELIYVRDNERIESSSGWLVSGLAARPVLKLDCFVYRDGDTLEISFCQCF